MHLPQSAEYALRAMASLALDEPPRQVRGRELADRTAIPVHYLSKIMRRLVTAGLVRSAKGHGGGFLLARKLDAIRFRDVFDAVSYDTRGGRCVFGSGRCSSRKGGRKCPLHDSWTEVNDVVVKWAEKTTLAVLRDPEFLTCLGTKGEVCETGFFAVAHSRKTPPKKRK